MIQIYPTYLVGPDYNPFLKKKKILATPKFFTCKIMQTRGVTLVPT
jgi:hypothetical protein